VPRHRRVIFPGVPHHVTQRGNHRERVFRAKGDPEAYLSLLLAYSRRFGIGVIAYCLMPNHVHLVVTPTTPDGVPRALRAVHGQYAQRVHRMHGVNGHLWQGRYFSCALDTPHFLNAVRYVELNPVRAGIIERPESYRWSSAAAHCGRRVDPLLEPRQRSSLLGGIADWSAWLAKGIEGDCLDRLRRHSRGNLPCGSDAFVAKLENAAGRPLRYRTPGGQKKT
jgi:putative transposase